MNAQTMLAVILGPTMGWTIANGWVAPWLTERMMGG